jgi:hypothetical protein
LSVFERYLSVWVALCIVVGTAIGRLSPALVGGLSRLEVSHVNLPIAVLIWLMIYPMMLRIDFAALRGVGQQPRGIFVVLFVNWLVKPFSMAFLGWLFFKHLFAGMIGPALGDQYLAGTIILAAAPCTAMVFVWSYLTDGDPAYTLVQVALNDLIMLVAFAPIVILLLGVSSITVPYDVLLYSVLLYIAIPLAAGAGSRAVLVRTGGFWFEQVFLGSVGVGDGAAGDPRPDLRLPGRRDPRQPFAYRADRDSAPHPGLFQLQPGLRSGPLAQGPARGGRPGRPDRREQLLRAGGGDGDLAVRPDVRRDAGDRRGRAGRGARHVVGLRLLQPDARLVPRALARPGKVSGA